MSEQVNRRKSYRWTSASQTNYDGADWDTSDEDDSDNNQNPQTMKLPTLPKLDYANDTTETKEEEQQVKPEHSVELELPVMPQQNHDIASDHDQLQVQEDEIVSLPQKSARQSKNNQFSDDLDNLMVQISKEMTPKELQQSQFTPDHIDVKSDNEESGHEEQQNDEDDEESDLEVAEDGYFNRVVEEEQEEEPHTENVDVEVPITAHDQIDADESEKSSFFDGYNSTNDSQQEEPLHEDGLSSEEEDIIDTIANEPSTLEIEGAPIPDLSYREEDDDESIEDSAQQTIPEQNHSHTDTSPIINEYDDEGDALSYTNSITYESDVPAETESHEEPEENESPFKFNKKKVRESIIDSSSSGSDDNYQKQDPSDVESSDDTTTMNVSKSGYFSKMIQEHDEDDSSIPDTPIKEKETDDDNDDILSMPSSIESKDRTPKADATEEEETEEGTPKLAEQITNEDTKEESEKEEHDDGNESIAKSITSDREDDRTEDEQNSTHNSEEENNESTKLDKSRQSVNLGKWKPDTEALRSGFVQETAKKAPPGFVYDGNGNLIDLTPSSMKGRAVSTYSGIESGWNAFPSDENGAGGDLETIKDARTIYDNNTIYNVPGLIGRNTGTLPPLPSNIDTTEQQPSQGPRLRSISNPISNPDKRIEGPGIHQPNSQEIAKINQNNAIPQLDLNKLISSNISYNAKYEQLTDYYQELGNYDSGIQTWISYSLKSSTKEKEFLFQEYKDNRHVREAYANAEDLTKKNTVINTVNTVNQNVNHLKKKVFSHTMNSMKPKMLFSSIGKKKL